MGPGEVAPAQVRAQIERGQWWVLEEDFLVAAVRVLESDPQVWPEPGPEPARYVHGLMVDHRAAGRRLGEGLLAWVEARAARAREEHPPHQGVVEAVVSGWLNPVSPVRRHVVGVHAPKSRVRPSRWGTSAVGATKGLRFRTVQVVAISGCGSWWGGGLADPAPSSSPKSDMIAK